jgi:hypothetical protein
VSADVPDFRARLASPASAGIVFLLTVVAGAASLPLAVLAGQAVGNVLIFRAGVALLALVLGSVGLVVARHQPRNPMGWLLLGSGLSFILGTDSEFYARLAYRLHPGRLPLGWVAVLLNAGWALAFIFLGAAVVLFPDGRLPSPHWRWPWRIYLALSAVWADGAVVILLAAVAGHHVQINSNGDLATIDHPTGAAEPWYVIGQAWRLVLIACLVAAVVQQAAGYRRASGVRRQQLKWVARPASPITRRGSCAPRAGRASRHCARCAGRRAKGHSHRAGTPRIIRAGPSSVKGTRRSFLRPLRRNDLQDLLEVHGVSAPGWLSVTTRRRCRAVSREVRPRHTGR